MLGIVLLTYERLDCSARTLRAVLSLAHTVDPIHLHIADDGSKNHEEDVNTLVRIAWEHLDANGGHRITWHNSERRGYGASYNLATQYLHDDCDRVLVLENDWELTRALDLDKVTTLLNQRTPWGQSGCVRLGYLGYTEPMWAQVDIIAGQKVLILNPDSPSRDVFAGHPRLETVTFQRCVGLWPEDRSPGLTELAVADRREAREGVIWPMELVQPIGDLFAHVGSLSLNAVAPGTRI